MISHEIFTRVLPKLKRAELSFHYQCGSNGTEESLLEEPCSMNVSLMENGTKNLLKTMISEEGKFDLTKPLVHDSIKIPAITSQDSKVAIDVSYLNSKAGFALHQAQIVTRQNCNPRWIRLQDMALVNSHGDYYKYLRLQYTYPLLSDFIHSDIGTNQLYKERLLWFENKTPYACAQICLRQSSCDMFYHQSDINKCMLFPHISLKDKTWSQSTFAMPPQYRNAIYILQCSLSTEDVLAPDPMTTKSFENWTIGRNQSSKIHRILFPENRLSILSSSNYVMSGKEGTKMSTTITENSLPLGMDNEFLKSFPQVCVQTYFSY